MKQKILTLLFALLGMVTSAWANVVIDGIHYNLNSTDHTASVTYIDRRPNNFGDYNYNVNFKYYGDWEIPQSITCNNEKYDVTSIGSHAFENCSSLTAINIPEGVTSIGDKAFYGCSSITTINIPEGVTSIGDEAFRGCSSITTINIPEGVTSIGDKAFYGCEQLTAINVSGDNANYQSMDGILYNKDLTKLLCYPAAKSGDETFIVPISIKVIESYAFHKCKKLTSIIFPSSVSVIWDHAFLDSSLKNFCILGNFGSFGLRTLPTSSIIYCKESAIKSIREYWSGTIEELKFYYPSGIQRDFRTMSFSLARKDLPEFIDSYVSASLKSVEFGYRGEVTPDKDGRYTINNLEPGKSYDITVTCQVLSGKEDFSIKQTEYTKWPNMTFSRTGSTQTSMTFSIDAESDATCTLTGKGVRCNGKDYYSTSDKVVVRGLIPNINYYIYPFAEYGTTRVVYNEKLYKTASMNPIFTTENVGPTSISVKGSYDKGDAHVSETGFTDQGTGNSLVLTGLTPNTSYTVEYYVKTEEGGDEKIKQTFTTPSLELTTLQPRCVSSTCAIVAAKTNMGDDEINAGFQWRKYDAPEELKSSEGYAAIYDGQLEGYIKNLQSASYYNVRAFYKSAEGNYYYGDWVTFDPSDFSYFEPTVHTYEATEIGSSSAKVKGYVLAGTDDIIEQGFEYLTTGSTECKAMRVRATDENNVSTVFGTGQVMTVTLTDLLPSSTYCFRSFVKTASGTTYGEEQTFTTDASTTGIGNVETDASSPVVVGYYDLSGRKHCEPQKGMNIVRYSDGSARKVFIK